MTKSDIAPFRMWSKRIESQFRLRLGVEIAEFVPWLKRNETVQFNCTAFLGSAGQVQIVLQSGVGSTREKLIRILSASPPGANEASSGWMKIARFSASSWEVLCSYDAKIQRFTLVIPKDLRELEILPRSGQIIVFACGEVLELWKPKDWLDHVKTIYEDADDAMNHPLEEIDGRNI